MYSERKGQGACVSTQQGRTARISWTGQIGGTRCTGVTIQWKLLQHRSQTDSFKTPNSQPTNLIILLRLNFSLILQFLSDEPQTWHRPSGCSYSVFSIFSNGSDFQNSSIRLPNRSTFPLTFNEGLKPSYNTSYRKELLYAIIVKAC